MSKETTMNNEQWALLEMLPPSNNHNPFHEYVTITGQLTPKGHALVMFTGEMLVHALQAMGETNE